MQITKLENRDAALAAAVDTLRRGGIVISPTDTVYGILGNAADESAVKKMFLLKRRPEEKAFPVFVKDIATARKYAYISDAKARLLKNFWPGPVTVVFYNKEKLPKILTGGKNTIGIRIPDQPFLLELLSRFGEPLAQTSANISDEPPAKNVEEIKEYFSGGKIEPDLVVDGGIIEGSSSVVTDFTGDRPKLLRMGPVSKGELDLLLGGTYNKDNHGNI